MECGVRGEGFRRVEELFVKRNPAENISRICERAPGEGVERSHVPSSCAVPNACNFKTSDSVLT